VQLEHQTAGPPTRVGRAIALRPSPADELLHGDGRRPAAASRPCLAHPRRLCGRPAGELALRLVRELLVHDPLYVRLRHGRGNRATVEQTAERARVTHLERGLQSSAVNGERVAIAGSGRRIALPPTQQPRQLLAKRHGASQQHAG